MPLPLDKNGVLLTRADSVRVECTIREIYPDGTLALESVDNAGENSSSGKSKTSIRIESDRTVLVT